MLKQNYKVLKQAKLINSIQNQDNSYLLPLEGGIRVSKRRHERNFWGASKGMLYIIFIHFSVGMFQVIT